MKAKVNLQLLKTTTFDSGALGMLAMVIHQFSSPGYYRAEIRKQNRLVTGINFKVDDMSEVMQLDIDLAQSVQNAKARPEDCDCKGEKLTKLLVSPKGYVLFHASSGYGYSVTVSNADGKVVFDNTKLDDGDLFAVSLLEPAIYSVTNTIDSTKRDIAVSLPTDEVKRLKTLETNYIEVNRKQFGFECNEITSSQGLVFRIKDSARILIEKKSTSTLKLERNKPAIRWQHLQTKID
jgi:hypothetical protein